MCERVHQSVTYSQTHSTAIRILCHVPHLFELYMCGIKSVFIGMWPSVNHISSNCENAISQSPRAASFALSIAANLIHQTVCKLTQKLLGQLLAAYVCCRESIYMCIIIGVTIFHSSHFILHNRKLPHHQSRGPPALVGLGVGQPQCTNEKQHRTGTFLHGQS